LVNGARTLTMDQEGINSLPPCQGLLARSSMCLEGIPEPNDNAEANQTEQSIKAYQWILIAICASLYTLWGFIDHSRLGGPYVESSLIASAAITIIITAITFATVSSVIGNRRHSMASLRSELDAARRAQSQSDAKTIARLLSIASDLSFSTSGIISQAEVALQSTTNLPDIKALSDIVDRGQALNAISHNLLELCETMAQAGSGKPEDRR